MAVNEWGWIKDNPVKLVKKKKEDNARDRWLKLDEEECLLAECPNWLRLIVVFALNTGMRQNEILSLEWQHVYLFRKVAYIGKTKNGNPKVTPLNAKAMGVLKEASKVRSISSNLIFSDGAGGKRDRSNVRRAFDSAVKKVGIKNFHFHDLRHTAATRLAQSGVDLYAIASFIGHEDLRSAKRYSHHCTESLTKLGETLSNFGCNMGAVGKKEAK